EDAEISMELDPTVTTAQHYPALRAMGFNRVSLGVQDFDDSVQSAIGRDQWSSVSYEAFERARCAGFDSINLDLLYGLPLQSTAHLERSAQSVAELGADRVAIFGYAHVPWMKPHQKKLERYGLPSGESRWEMFQAARRVFYAAGYEPVGFDHFAKPDDELVQHSGCLNRNFQGYTVLDPMPVLAFGASAIADLSDRFVQNEKRLSAYMDAVFEGRPAAERMCIRGEDDEVRRALITEFMCNMELHGCTLPQAQADVFRGVLSTPNPVLDELVADELVRISRDRLAVTERGRAFLRVVASVFDAYLECPTEARFSHAV
ncbi:MAG: radical SAM protein, partial [Myxococcota bacterium]